MIKIFKIGIKYVVIWGNGDCHGGCNMLLVLGSCVCVCVFVRLHPEIEVPYIPFTGCMFLDFFVIALLDQIFKIGIKRVVIRGNDECHGGYNMSLVLCLLLL